MKIVAMLQSHRLSDIFLSDLIIADIISILFYCVYLLDMLICKQACWVG